MCHSMETNMKKARLILTILTILELGSTLPPARGQNAPVSPKPKLSSKDIEEMMTALSNWGRWGKDDQLGTLNLITSRKRKAAAMLVKEGVSISLARDLSEMKGNGSAAFVHKMILTGQS